MYKKSIETSKLKVTRKGLDVGLSSRIRLHLPENWQSADGLVRRKSCQYEHTLVLRVERHWQDCEGGSARWSRHNYRVPTGGRRLQSDETRPQGGEGCNTYNDALYR